MLEQAIKRQLGEYLANLEHEVILGLNLDDSDKSRELAALADDITSVSERVHLSGERAGSGRSPAMIVKSAALDTEIEFAGIPMGHEFTSLVLALLHSGGHPVKLDDATIDQIKSLNGEYVFEIYVSLGCQTCPDVVQALNTMAALNPHIKTVMIDGALFQQEVDDRNILAVPTVYLNGEKFSQGRLGIADILLKLDTALAAQSLQSLSKKAPYDLLIVGGGPAGASAAIYAARKGLRTGIVADNFGGQVLDTLGIENFISVKATEGPRLVASLEEHVREYDVDILQGQRAAAITEQDESGFRQVTLESGANLRARSVLLATGARWRQINVPGEDQYRGHGVAYCPHCDGPLFKGRNVAVIGGGNSGIEAAIDLAGIVAHVTVLEFASDLKADSVLIDKARSMNNIEIITDAQTLSIEGDGRRVEALTYLDRESGEEKSLQVAGVFIQIGLVPNTEFVRDSLELNPMGEIRIDGRNETSMPGVFAAGDVTDVAYKQIIIAMGSGANAALGAFDYLIRQQPAEVSLADEAA